MATESTTANAESRHPQPIQQGQPQPQPPQTASQNVNKYSRILPRPDNMPAQQALVTRLRKAGPGGPAAAGNASAPKRSRAGKPKVRTGCQTCKLRHVKCDERKPSCMRCQSVNIPCQGYVEPTARRSSKRAAMARSSTSSSSSSTPTPTSAATASGAAPPLLLPRDTSVVPASPLSTVSALPRSPTASIASPTSPFSPASSSFSSDTSLSLARQQPLGLPPPSFSLPPVLYRGVSLKPRLDPQDVVYFDYFRNQVTSNRAGFYTTSIWSRLVAGEALPDDCIHHSILAIGAFMRCMSEAAPASSFFPESAPGELLSSSSALSAPAALMSSFAPPTDLDRVINQHHTVALRHHVKAVTSFRQKLSQLAWSSPTAVVTTTLMLVVFELLQGNRVAANKLIDSATALLQGFHSRVLPGAVCRGAVSGVSAEQVLQQSLTLGGVDGGVGSGVVVTPPESLSADHEFRDMEWVLPIISVMNQLSHLGRRPSPPPLHLGGGKFDAADVDFQFPEPDHDSISKLFLCWGRFFTHCIIFLRQCIYTGLDTFASQDDGGPADGQSRSADGQSPSPSPTTSDAPSPDTPHAAPPPPTLVSLIPRQKIFLAHLCRWRAILADYASSARIDDAGKNALRLARVHWLLLHITVSCCLDPTQMMYDVFVSELGELNRLCVGLIRDNLSRERPTSVLLGEGLILPLSAVVRFCRHHNTRMTAAAIIRQIPPSMIAWDAPAMLDGLLGAVLLEEGGRTTEWPESEKSGDTAGSGFGVVGASPSTTAGSGFGVGASPSTTAACGSGGGAVIPPSSRWFWLEEDESTKPYNLYQCLVPDPSGRPVYKRVAKRRPDLWADICRTAGCTTDHVF